MKNPAILVIIIVTLKGFVLAEEEPRMTLQLLELTAEEVLEIYAMITDSTVVFRDRKEMRRVVSASSAKVLTYAEAKELIEAALKLEGMEVRRIANDKVEVVKTLDEAEVRKLNKEAGRIWKGPRYDRPAIGRAGVPSKVRFEPKKDEGDKAQQPVAE